MFQRRTNSSSHPVLKLIQKFIIQRRTISSSRPVVKLILKFLLKRRTDNSSCPVLKLILKFIIQRTTISSSSHPALKLILKFLLKRRTDNSSCPVLKLILKFMIQRTTISSSSHPVLKLILKFLLKRRTDNSSCPKVDSEIYDSTKDHQQQQSPSSMVNLEISALLKDSSKLSMNDSFFDNRMETIINPGFKNSMTRLWSDYEYFKSLSCDFPMERSNVPELAILNINQGYFTNKYEKKI